MKRKGLIELAKFDMDTSDVESIYATGTRYVILAERKQEMLILTIFDVKHTELNRAKVVVFIKQDDYISLELIGGNYKWRTGALRNILSLGYWSSDRAKFWLKTHEDVTKTFLKADTKEDAVDAIINFQDRIMEKRLKKRHKKITDKIDKQMEIVPELPGDFSTWIDNVPLGFSRYLVYKRNKKEIQGFCTYCKKDVELGYAKHNEKGTCPNCSTIATYKAKGKAKRIEDYTTFSIMQKVTEHDGTPGILIRYFEGIRDFKHDRITAPETYVTEKVRSFYRLDGTLREYEYNLFRQRYTRWNNENFNFDNSQTILYSSNVNEVLKDTMWQYSTIDLMARRNKYFRLQRFMECYPSNPRIEYIVKAGLYNLANDTITSYRNPKYKAKTIKDFLGVGAEVLPQLKRLDVSYSELGLIQKAYMQGIKVTDEQVLWASENLTIPSDIIQIAKYTTIHKGIRYIENHIKGNKNAYSDWLDYLRMCEQLQYDMKSTFVLFPKQLKQAHDEVTVLIEYESNKEHDKAIESMRKELEHSYKFNDSKYCILIPESAKEIVNESITLRHCVKTYISDVAKGFTVILFIREIENLNKPFYTLEVKKGKVMQCRGYSNKDMTKEVERFIEKFKKAKLLSRGKTKSA